MLSSSTAENPTTSQPDLTILPYRYDTRFLAFEDPTHFEIHNSKWSTKLTVLKETRSSLPPSPWARATLIKLRMLERIYITV